MRPLAQLAQNEELGCADGIFITAIPLSSHLLTASDLTPFDQVVPADPGNGQFYSVTERFTVTANGVEGVANATADIAFVPASSVPGPVAGAGFPGLIFAGGGLLGWWRRRQKTPGVRRNSEAALSRS